MVAPHQLAELVPELTVGELARPHGKLRWLTAGRGAPVILLVSGAGETALDWLPILAPISALSTVVAVDRAGLGLSDPAGRVSVESQVDDLVAVLARVGPAILVGHSWGGLLVQLVARRQPASVVGLVLVDPSHEELSASMPLRWRAALAGLGPAPALVHRLGLFPRLARPMGRKLAARCTADPALQAAIENEYVASYRRRHQVAMISAENRLGAASVSLMRAARIAPRLPDVPLVVLTATTGKPPALQEQSAQLHAGVAAEAPRGRQIVVENSGHYIHHDRPEAVIDAIADMLARDSAES
jgi:pimeloyl-ACP methyl ester carboxylesterase